MNYDPNMTLCGRMAIQTVKLVFGTWRYRAEMTVQVGGNCRGMTVIDSAVGIAYDKLERDRHDCAFIVMEKPDGTRNECSDDEEEGEDWLKDMIISAEIIDIQPKDENDTGRDEE